MQHLAMRATIDKPEAASAVLAFAKGLEIKR